MRFTERQRIVFKTNLARDRAETLLRELLDASRAVQIHNVIKSRPTMNCGPNLEQAISSGRRLVEVLNGALSLSEHDLDDAEMNLIDEFSLLDGQENADSGDDLDALLRAEGIMVGEGDEYASVASVNSSAGMGEQRDLSAAIVGGNSNSSGGSGGRTNVPPTAAQAAGGGGSGSSGLHSGVGSDG